MYEKGLIGIKRVYKDMGLDHVKVLILPKTWSTTTLLRKVDTEQVRDLMIESFLQPFNFSV